MASRDFLLKQQLLRFLGQLKQTKRICNGRATLRHSLGNLRLRHIQTLHHATIAIGLFDRIQIGTLDVLDKCKFQRLVIIGILDADRHFGKASKLRSLPTALAGDNLIRAFSNRPDKNRL